MDLSIMVMVILFFVAFICEYIDSSVGMGYGTILSPILLIVGFDPVIAIPAVLISQTVGGITASFFHHRLDNIKIHKASEDLKLSLLIMITGVIATIVACFISININKFYIKLYIGILVCIMGFILLLNRKFKFSWKKMIGVSLISSFNKGISGGGFGPVVTSGQILSGKEGTSAIGVTTLSEIGVCTTGAITYLIYKDHLLLGNLIRQYDFKGFFDIILSNSVFSSGLVYILCVASMIAAPLGAYTTSRLKDININKMLGLLVLVIGFWTICKTVFF